MKRLFYNGKIATFDAADTFCEVMGIEDNKICFLGSAADLDKIMSEYDEAIDLEGKTVLPGLNDSHIHLLNIGYTMTKLDLTQYKSIEASVDGARAFIKEKELTDGMWLLARGWNQDRLQEKRYPHRRDLDEISSTNPIIFTRACGHVAICNTAAIEALGSDALNADDPNINIDAGLFQEEALNQLYESAPSPSVEEIKSMILDASRQLVAYGVTSVQSDDLRALPDQDHRKVLKAFQELAGDGQLPLRVYEQCLFFDELSLESFISEGHKTGQGDSFFKIGPVKLLLDGSLGGRTALMRAPYSDAPDTTGIACFKQDELNRMVTRAQEGGFQIAAHGIGDKAMDMFLDALRAAPAFDPKDDNRHGIVHAQITTPDIIQSMAEMNLLAYVQPIFLDYDLHIVQSRVGDRSEDAYTFKTMAESGVTLCAGTDAPVVDANPFENIYSAVVRRDLNLQPEEPYLEHECLTVSEAIRAYTAGSAYSAFEEGDKGSLEIGKFADFIVLGQDIFTVEPAAIKDIQVDMTVIDGKTLHQRP